MYNDTSTAEAIDHIQDSREKLPSKKFARAQEIKPIVRSRYLVKRLFKTPHNNLFNFVKFRLVNQHIKRMGITSPRIMDVGCGLKVAERFLTALNKDISYFGIDYEPTFGPDAVVDLNKSGSLKKPMQWTPDVVMLLDVLEHLHEDKEDLSSVVEHVARSMPDDAHLIVTVPQWYRLDRFKLKHLHYPEHKIRLTQKEWREILDQHFDIVATQGVGYLSVLPYLPMALPNYKPDNSLGRLFSHLRSTTFEKPWIKPFDLFLSNTLGRIAPFKHLSNDILFIARAKSE